MLRVTTLYASSALATAAYYTRYLAEAPGEQAGVWSGQQSAALGLSGRVAVDELQALLEGRDPMSGTPLGATLVDRTLADGRVIRAVAGFDATFSAPKSLSVWWALTSDPGLLEATVDGPGTGSCRLWPGGRPASAPDRRCSRLSGRPGRPRTRGQIDTAMAELPVGGARHRHGSVERAGPATFAYSCARWGSPTRWLCAATCRGVLAGGGVRCVEAPSAGWSTPCRSIGRTRRSLSPR
jgi:hypothetical protein